MGQAIVNRDRLRLLHARGRSDREIAEALGVAVNTVWRNRRAMKLAANTPTDRLGTSDIDLIRQRAGEGCTSAAVAREIGATESAVVSAASRAGIKFGAKRREEIRRRAEAIVAKTRAGCTQSEIAQALGISVATVRNWQVRLRKRGALPPLDATPRVAAVPDAPRVAAVPPKPVVQAEPDPLDHLRARFGVEVVQAVARIGRKGSYRRLSEVAATHALPIRSVEGIWHRVRAS
ncbi:MULTISPECIES: sigma factor-like helix-turn-helix DNA-binding protein [unclassified Mameliella]|uniref:sigma factor-like helix-turn-helix DNA-binding protein n=1 Tax=unclassified Mameliella TaxID=2630630 RepID=UPI00273D478B|nr:MULTISPECIES: sigma factor-like helix-turn-helix DNA-binding protein [unclassified Mameliella]